MLEAAALTYGLMTGFVLTSAQRNRKASRPNSRIVEMCGWLLMGISTGGAALAIGCALVRFAG